MCEEILKSGFFASTKNSCPVKVYVFSAFLIQEIFFKIFQIHYFGRMHFLELFHKKHSYKGIKNVL